MLSMPVSTEYLVGIERFVGKGEAEGDAERGTVKGG